jgi:hypothetical protein
MIGGSPNASILRSVVLYSGCTFRLQRDLQCDRPLLFLRTASDLQKIQVVLVVSAGRNMPGSLHYPQRVFDCFLGLL